MLVIRDRNNDLLDVANSTINVTIASDDQCGKNLALVSLRFVTLYATATSIPLYSCATYVAVLYTRGGVLNFGLNRGVPREHWCL